ncbi:GNAT family N-acetyltransferase [Haloarchaeobius sp. HME9146]|uniref:GNAT family N-acetyltransferase n=1 Tax=Haloarchaeobius sp. HME9146 TaxID=2978732 RepID=UPI0021C0B197|nr:GNAT family protein [Haloarchaeobius sp. HME9146]MCT9097112.1 GNAT family N-acetyltransferase [Haloarchaeobius sp. HME9146]
MSRAVFLHGESVDLCPIDEADLDFLGQFVNDPKVWPSLGMDGPVNDKQGKEWFEEHVSKDDTVNFLITVDGEPVGTINAFDLSERHGHATLGCWLAPEFHGQGFGSDATRAILRYLFDHRRMRTVVAYVFGFNEQSIGLLESVGMERVGSLPDWVFVGGEHHDAHVYAASADSWDCQIVG